MHVERIVITGDVFRTTIGEANQLPNVHWLCDELRGVLHELTGLQPEVGYRRNQADDGRAMIADWYGLLGHTPSVEAWAATYGETAPPALLDALAPDYARALVVGFELSPVMRSALDGLGVPWIDVEVSPIRFLDDLALTLRCSWAVDAAPPHPGLVTAGQVAEAVVRLRAELRGDPAAAACAGACVFLAQTHHDRTLIKDGAFFPVPEAAEGVGQALNGRRLVLKPHPLAPDNPLLGVLQRCFAGHITEANIYALLAAASDAQLLTISSSAAIEARHFGHDPQMLHPTAHARPAPFTSLWAHRSAAFWRTALAPILSVRADATFEERTIPDRLRRRLGAWGFPRPSPPPVAAGPTAEHAATGALERPKADLT